MDLPEECEGLDCVESLSVQPYLLHATDYTAPWIPTDYALNLPWCITWHVKGATYADGRTIGESNPLERAQGTVVGGEGAGLGAGSRSGSTYSVTGAHMEWLNEDGTTTPIPVGADEFDPALGASVTFNGHALRTDSARGTWKKKGKTWEYTTKGSVVRDAFTLRLDFGKARWDFEGSRLDLADHLRAGEKAVRLELVVNGLYTFSCDIEHEARIEGSLAVPPQGDGYVQMTSYTGTFNSISGNGDVLLQGLLPAELLEFGDLSIALNGHWEDMPLLALDQFQSALEDGQVLVYDHEGVHAVVDFGRKTWSVEIGKGSFRPLMAPRWGGLRLCVQVGGVEQDAREHAIASYTTKLSFGQ